MSSRARTGSNEAITRGILAAAAAGVLVAVYVPPVTDRLLSDQVSCPVRLATGWRCPFCGMTHATVSLLHGDIGAMVGQNAFAVVFVLGLAALLAASFGVGWPRRLPPPSKVLRRASVALLVTSFVAFSVLRNVVT